MQLPPFLSCFSSLSQHPSQKVSQKRQKKKTLMEGWCDTNKLISFFSRDEGYLSLFYLNITNGREVNADR